MTTTGDDAISDNDTALEELLGHATPRLAPPAEVTAAARSAVLGEWRQLTRNRTRRRRLTMLATAATVVLAVTLVMNTWLAPAVQPVQVATLEKTIGTIYLLGEKSELHKADNLKVVSSGETIVTAADAGVGLRWGNGGSLRMAENTEVRFSSDVAVELVSGRVYFDSMPSTGVAAPLTIITAHGNVTHVGTQYMTDLDGDSLTVRVREGRVSIDGRFHDVVGTEGEQWTVTGSRRPERANIAGFGPGWEWVEATAPVAAMDGKRLLDFLEWVSRETGLKLQFESDDVETVARKESVEGDISDAPRDALRQSLLAADLSYDIDNGVIRVSQAGN